MIVEEKFPQTVTVPGRVMVIFITILFLPQNRMIVKRYRKAFFLL